MRLFPAAAFALFLAAPLPAQTYTIKTFAGGALPENRPAAGASLGTVTGLATNAAGDLYLALGDYDIVVRVDASTGILTRVAGDGTRGFSGDGGQATGARLSSPAGIAVDAGNNLYIADSGNYRIRMVSKGVITTVAGNGTAGYSGDGGPAVNAQFNGLAGIVLDTAGNLYIAEFYNQVVRKLANGVVTTVAGNGVFGDEGDNGPAVRAQLGGPSGLALDTAGSLYIAEAYNSRVRKVVNGTISTVAGTGAAGFSGDRAAATAATLRQPSGVALDTAGNLYIADLGNNRIRVVSSAGVITTFAGAGTATFAGDGGPATSAGLVAPQGIVTDASGNLYVADGVRVRKIAKTLISTVAGGGVPSGENGPAASAQLLAPQGLAVDGSNVYISDRGTGRVLKVSTGTLTRVAGTGTQGSSGDNGPATSAQLNSPHGLAVDGAGNLFVADNQALRLRKISSGTITTVAGAGSVFGDNGPAASAQLRNPRGIAVDGGGNLYIADLNRIRMIDATNGVISTVAGTGNGGYQGDNGPATAAYVASPSGVAADSTGNYFIADTGNNRVRMVSNGVVTTVAGNGNYGATSATLGAPSSVAVDSSGDLYITDAYRLLKVSKGKISTLAGFLDPQAVAVDRSGEIYVGDPASHRVYVLSPAGTNCAVTLAPAANQIAAEGGTVSVALQTGTNCPWAVENLPEWIALPNAFGTGPATVRLVAAPNTDTPRSAAVTIGSQAFTLSQAGTISIIGQVTHRTGAVLAGVSLTLGGSKAAVASSDTGGNYSFTNLGSSGTYTVTPSLAGYSFVPPTLTFSNATTNPTANFAAWPVPRITGLAPVFASLLQPVAASFAPGEIVTVFGSDLCADPASAAPTLPDRLAGCIVQVDGVNVRFYYASADQVNAVLPQALQPGPHSLVVQRYTDLTYRTVAAQSQPLNFAADKIAAAFLERSDGAARMLVAQFPDGGFAGPGRPLRPGDTITLYLSGLGRKARTFNEGAAPGVASAAVEPVQITVEGQAAQVLYSGVQPQYPGLDQITLRLPAYTLPAGTGSARIVITTPSTGRTLQYAVNSN